MSTALALLAYAAVTGLLGARWLPRARWPERAPRLGVLTWQALTGSVVVSTGLAGFALAMPTWPMGGKLAGILDTCVMLLREQYATPGGATTGTVGLVLSAGAFGSPLFCLVRAWWAARTGRRQQRESVTLLGTRDADLDVTVLEHPACAAYCVPGRGGSVVITSAALAALDASQIEAVLAHERAHLSGHHHLVIQAAAALRRAFPFLPVFAVAFEEISRLTEMVADDASASGRDRLTLATALVRLAEGAAPAGALGAGGSTAAARVRRLAATAAPLRNSARLLAAAGVVVLLAVPFAAALSPALAVASSRYCPISMAD